MFLKKNISKVRSLFSNFAVVGLATTALFWGANTASVNAQTGDVDAPTGGTTNKLLDFNGNGTTDFVTLALPAGGPISWRVLGNPANPAPNQALIRRFNYGIADDDSIVVGDYVGDNKNELAVFRNTAASAPGIFYLAQFPIGTGGVTLDRAVQWGNGFSDVAGATGDYDGDGKVDYTVVRVSGSSLVWYVLSSSTNTSKAITFGSLTGVTGPSVFPGADFNGDGRDEFVYVTRNASGNTVTYYIGDANTGAGVVTRSFGNFNTDFNVAPADYTGDGRADFASVRETDPSATAIWYILNTATNTVTATRFGIADPAFTDLDVPVRGDYDGDNRHDIAVYRASNRTFYYISSQFNNIQAQQFGDAGDTPLASFGLY
jgi:hypothetical protein